MAKTTITTSDALRKTSWEEQLFRDTMVDSYFLPTFAADAMTDFVMGQGFKKDSNGFYVYNGAPNGIVQVKANLGAVGRTKTRNGDKVTFGLIPGGDPRTDAGVVSGQTLKGHEKALSWYNYSLELERYRQAVSAGGPMDWTRASFNMPTEAQGWLKDWGAKKMDYLCFAALEAAPTNIFYKTSDTGPTVSKTATLATAKAALTAADSKLTPEFASYLKAWAKTGGARTIVPIRPIKVNGKPYYVLLTHDDALFDWKQDATWSQAVREAAIRGNENPIFTGAEAIYDGVVVHTHEYVTTGTDGGGASVPWCYGHLLGQQALVWAWGERPSVIEDTDDYEEELYYAWRMTSKVGAPQFNSQTYGSISFVVSRTNVSGT